MANDKEIRVVVVGAAGEMGSNCVRYCTERGATVVGAIGRTHHVGDDAGTVAGIDPLGVTIEPADKLFDVIDEVKPDVVIEASSNLKNVAPKLEGYAKRGVNVAMLAEEAYYSKVDMPELTAKIDALAKEHGITVIGMGMQDVNWSNEAVVMAANCHKLDAIYGENWCILDHCGAFEIGLVGVNLTEDEFYEYHKDNLYPRSPFTFSLYEIADEMGLTVTKEENAKIEPLIARADYTPEHCDAHPETIAKGKTIGSALCTTLLTEEGIELTGKFLYSFAQDGQPGEQVWRFTGEPTFTVTTDDPRPDIGTTTDIVNRLPDIIAAPAGFLTVGDLPKPFFHSHPLPEYL